MLVDLKNTLTHKGVMKNQKLKFKQVKFLLKALNSKSLSFVQSRLPFLPTKINSVLISLINRTVKQHNLYDESCTFFGYATLGRRMQGTVKASHGNVYRTKRRYTHIIINLLTSKA